MKLTSSGIGLFAYRLKSGWKASGAVDLEACPSKTCHCGTCIRCGFPIHTAIHGSVDGQRPGSKPYGHEAELRSRPKWDGILSK
jgi:hypothetical protein